MAANSKKQHGKPFPKGTSGNPLGRPKMPYDIVAACRAFTAEGVRTLIDIARKQDYGDAAIMGVKVRAVQTLLDRGWGTAPQKIEIAGDLTIKRIILED